MSTPSRKPTAPLFGRWTPKNDFVFGRWTPSVKSVKGKKEETATSSERHEKREFGSALSQQHINQLIGGDNPTQQRRPGFVNLDKLKALIAHNDAEDQAEEERGLPPPPAQDCTTRRATPSSALQEARSKGVSQRYASRLISPTLPATPQTQHADELEVRGEPDTSMIRPESPISLDNWATRSTRLGLLIDRNDLAEDEARARLSREAMARLEAAMTSPERRLAATLPLGYPFSPQTPHTPSHFTDLAAVVVDVPPPSLIEVVKKEMILSHTDGSPVFAAVPSHSPIAASSTLSRSASCDAVDGDCRPHRCFRPAKSFRRRLTQPRFIGVLYFLTCILISFVAAASFAEPQTSLKPACRWSWGRIRGKANFPAGIRLKMGCVPANSVTATCELLLPSLSLPLKKPKKPMCLAKE